MVRQVATDGDTVQVVRSVCDFQRIHSGYINDMETPVHGVHYLSVVEVCNRSLDISQYPVLLIVTKPLAAAHHDPSVKHALIVDTSIYPVPFISVVVELR